MMDADGSGFSFTGTDFSRGQDAADPMSWGDIFLDSIVADDPPPPDSSDANGISDSVLGSSAPQQVLQQSSQPSAINQQQLQIQLAQQTVNQQILSDTGTNIPTHLQATLTNNGVPQSNTSNVGGSVAYLTSSQHQHLSSGGNIQNVLANNQTQAAVTVSQGGTKLVQIAPSFPVAAVQQLPNSVPLQTLLQPGQQIAGQTIYGGQNPSLFPTQGSVHIENPKVVNVNFGPHVIQPDGNGQQTIIQTAEGKRVLITNSQLQHLPQSLSLTQPIVGTQLIHPTGSSVNNVIRTTVAQATSALVASSTPSTRQILLPTGQTVISRQNGNPQAGFSKNVLLRPLNPGVQPVIYQSGQSNVAGQLIQSQPTLIASSGAGLQVVNAGANQGNQVQLIAQPSLTQSNMGHQQLNQSALMNLIGNQGVLPNAGNQLPGLVHGQNILVNGQMLNLSQVGGLNVPLQVQGTNTQGAVTVAGINSGNRPSPFGTAGQQMVIQQPNGQQQIMIQPKNTPSPSIIQPNAGGNQRTSSFTPKIARTPTPSANSASSTPALTPTPSTPTPTPTPDLGLGDFGNSGSKSSQNFNILEEALKLSSIDLRPYEEEDFNFIDETIGDSVPCITSPPATLPTYLPPKTKPQPAPPKPKAKSSKPKAKPTQPIVNVTVNNNLLGQSSQAQNTQAQKVNITPQQKIITASGQVYVISANGQQLVLQQTPTSSVATSVAKTPVMQPSVSVSSATPVTTTSRSSINISVSRSVRCSGDQTSKKIEPVLSLAQIKSETQSLMSLSKSLSSSNTTHTGSQLFFKGGMGTLKPQTVSSASELLPKISTSISGNQKYSVQIKNQQISTLAGKICKQEPMPIVVKQEPQTDDKPPFSFFDPPQPQSSSVFPTTSVVSVSAPHVCLSSNTLSTNTSLSQHSAIMSTVSPHSISGSQGHANLSPLSHAVAGKTTSAAQDVTSSHVSPPLSLSAHSTSKNSKGKDSTAHVKSLTQIKIANTTLKLSLTPHEKERLESQISDMSMEKQEQLLSHQQKIIWRSQDLQKKQQEQQHQRFQQQRMLIQKQKELQQSMSASKPVSVASPACSSNNNITDVNRQGNNEISDPVSASTGLPTTVQELIDKSDTTPPVTGMEKPLNQQHQSPQQNEKPVSTLHETPSQKFVSSQAHASILHSARCLRAEQQLHRDCTLALAPDTQTPFKNLSDAMRRLVRYHTMQDHKPEEDSDSLKKWDSRYTKVCERLMKKKRCYMRRFSRLQQYNDMCCERWPDGIQNLKSFNESVREHLNGEMEQALNHPDTFRPLQPELLMPSASRPSENDQPPDEDDGANDDDSSADDCEQQLSSHSKSFRVDHDPERQPVIAVKTEIKEEPTTPSSTPSMYSVSSRKRRNEENPSSGTLKFVFKRRTTDNFVVQSSMHEPDCVPRDYKPVVDMDVCDKLYEFDSKSDVSQDNSVLVHRRDSLISQTSRQSLSEQETSSESFHSSQSKEEEESDDDAEAEEEEEDDDDEEEEEDDDRSSSGNEETVDEETNEQQQHQNEADAGFLEMQQPIDGYFASFNEEISTQQPQSEQLIAEDRKLDLDALADTSQWETESIVYSQQEESSINANSAPAKYSDISTSDFISGSGDGSSRTSKKSFSPPDIGFRHHSLSVTSDDVFISNPTMTQPDKCLDEHSRKESTPPSLHDLIGKDDDSFMPASDTKFPEFSAPSIQSSRSQTPLHELVAKSPVSHLETAAASQLLPSTALFTTPNKNLLQTDFVMFNSSEDEDDEKDSAMSSFKIDNKDPQSSMINDSVRTAIDSVINKCDDDDDLNESSQTSWASTAHRRSSFFHSSLSSSVSPTHDLNLEAAVENILQS